MRARELNTDYIGAKWGATVAQPFASSLAHPRVCADLGATQLQPIRVDVVRKHVESFLFEDLWGIAGEARGLCADVGRAIAGDERVAVLVQRAAAFGVRNGVAVRCSVQQVRTSAGASTEQPPITSTRVEQTKCHEGAHTWRTYR